MRLGLDFVSYCAFHLPNRFIDGVRESGKPVITWTVRDDAAMSHRMRQADQITFEGFDPRMVASSPG
jgi:glycerophosphoryl diester phosphodiesterase